MRAMFLLLLALSESVHAQQPQVPPLVETAEVRLVNVDVTVTDSTGRPVSGLTQADFEVFEDDQAQTISGFYSIEDAAIRFLSGNAAVPQQDDLQFRRKIILMVDNNTLQKPPRDAAIEFVANFIENKHEAEEWSVVTVGHGTETLQPFTTDKEAIRSALLTARRKPVNIQERLIDRDLLSDPVRAHLRSNAEGSGYDFDSTARFQSREQTARNLQAMKNTARAVIQTCRAYSASSGRKVLILLTGGMELNTTFAVYDSGRDQQLNDMKKDMERTLDTTVREANAASFKIYIVKGGGQTSRAPQHDVSNRTAGLGGTMKNPFFGPGFSQGSDVSDVDSSSLALALRTGGQYFAGRTVADALLRIDDALSNSYSIAYIPKGPEDGKYHRLSVKVKRPEVTAHHRDGYLAISTEQRLEQSLRAPITFSKEKGDLPVILQVGPPERTADGKPLVVLTATMPISSLSTIPRGGSRLGRIHVYLTIYDEQGNNVGFHHQIQNLQIPTQARDAKTNEVFRYTTKVALKKGAFTLVVTLRDEISGEIGSAIRSIKL